MAIQITLLKVRHYGESEAKKLAEHISTCDVYGPEAPFSTELDASGIEDCWETLLSSNLSRSALREHFEQPGAYKRYSPSNIDAEQMIVYDRKMRDYLYRSKKPLWHLERFSQFDSIKARQLFKRAKTMKRDSTTLLCNGDLDGFFAHYWKGLEDNSESIRLRDCNMEQNISVAECRIRERYPQLRDKDPLVYVAHMGGQHTPENYTPIRVTVRNLCDIDTDDVAIFARIHKDYKSGKTLQEMQGDILAAGVYLASLNFNWGLTRGAIQSMGFDQLCEVVRGKTTGTRKS